MSAATFATAITCMDGRIQLPVIHWMTEALEVDYVDLVTEPGADAALATGQISKTLAIKERVILSVERHGSRVVAVIGHHDCAAVPGGAEEHRKYIKDAVKVVRTWTLGVDVIGLWVNEQWKVEVVETT